MRRIVIAAALGVIAVLALIAATADPQTQPARATAALPDADPVIVDLDTRPPLAANHRDGFVTAAPTRRFTDI